MTGTAISSGWRRLPRALRKCSSCHRDSKPQSPRNCTAPSARRLPSRALRLSTRWLPPTSCRTCRSPMHLPSALRCHALTRVCPHYPEPVATCRSCRGRRDLRRHECTRAPPGLCGDLMQGLKVSCDAPGIDSRQTVADFRRHMPRAAPAGRRRSPVRSCDQPAAPFRSAATSVRHSASASCAGRSGASASSLSMNAT